MEQPLVDIVLISYNGDKYIKQQIESILGQDYPNFRLYLCDDGSTDSTVKILNNYACHDNVTVHAFKNNLGIRNHLERSLALCTAGWVAISDQDDIWSKRKISVLMQSRGDASLVFCNSRLVDENGVKQALNIVRSDNLVIGSNAKALFMGNVVSGHALICKREIAEKLMPFDTGMIYDYQLAIGACLMGGVKYVPAELVYHRRHANNNWHKPENARPADETRAMRNQRREDIAMDTLRTWRFWFQLSRKEALSVEFQKPNNIDIVNLLERFVAKKKRFSLLYLDSLYLFMHLYRRKNEYFHSSIKVKALWKRCFFLALASKREAC